MPVKTQLQPRIVCHQAAGSGGGKYIWAAPWRIELSTRAKQESSTRPSKMPYVWAARTAAAAPME